MKNKDESSIGAKQKINAITNEDKKNFLNTITIDFIYNNTKVKTDIF